MDHLCLRLLDGVRLLHLSGLPRDFSIALMALELLLLLSRELFLLLNS